MSQFLYAMGRCAVLMTAVLGMAAASAARAQGNSPYDAYYKQQESAPAPASAGSTVPIDNDQYYTAPGQYIENKNYPAAALPYAPPAKSKGCNSISDSPDCLGD